MTKDQCPRNDQFPNPNWSLVIGNSLGIGHWTLVIYHSIHRVACVVGAPPLRCGFPSVKVLILVSKSFTAASSPHDLASSMADLMVLTASSHLPVSACAAASV